MNENIDVDKVVDFAEKAYDIASIMNQYNVEILNLGVDFGGIIKSLQKEHPEVAFDNSVTTDAYNKIQRVLDSFKENIDGLLRDLDIDATRN